MTSDSKDRKRALDPARSFIVQAPAGSGKTELLIQRYLKLLSGVEYPEQILAMTFTRKAAGEMKHRILKALEDAKCGSPPELEHTKLTWVLAQKVLKRNQHFKWRLLENTSRLKIQTIDSFCLGLIQQTPLLSRLGGTPALQENPKRLYRQAAYRVLGSVETKGPTGEAVSVLLKHLNNSKLDFINKIVALLEKRDQWYIPFFGPLQFTEDSRTYLENILTQIIEPKLKGLSSQFSPEEKEKLLRLGQFAADNLAASGSDSPIVNLLGISYFPSSNISNLLIWKGFTELLLVEEGLFRKQVNKAIGFPISPNIKTKQCKEEFKEFLSNIAFRTELRQALHAIRTLPLPQFTDKEWNLLQSFLTLLPEVQSILRNVFSELGETDFAEISLSALKALGEEKKGEVDPTDLLLKLDLKFQHILVDEYQDTSFKQYKLLEKLATGWTPGDGRTLFVVGDPMQSIFRFRDSEVGLFLDTREFGFQNVNLEPLTLTSNFRSQRALVKWINNCFRKLFPPMDNPVSGAICFTSSEPMNFSTVNAPVNFYHVSDPKSDEEAHNVIRIIRGIRKNYSDPSIAILARYKNHLDRIIIALRENNISHRAEEIHKLSNRPVILDLLALVRALLCEADRCSWLSILRAPWCGLDLKDLHLLCHGEKKSSIWSLLNDVKRMASLSKNGQIRAQRFLRIMSLALSTKSTHSFRDTLEGCWIALGGPACIDPSELKDAEIFIEKITDVLDSGGLKGLQGFENDLEDLFAFSGMTDSTSIQVMTIHKAKGLEFDHVILPGLGRKPNKGEKKILHWLPYKDDFLIAPVHEKGGEEFPIYKFLSLVDKEKEKLESMRLLYVAATRAKRQLHLSGHAPSNKSRKLKPIASSLLDQLWPFLKREWPIFENDSTPKPQSADSNCIGSFLRRLPVKFKLPQPETGIVIETSIISKVSEPEFLWAGNLARCLGTVLHAVFQNVSSHGTGNWNNPKSIQKRISTALLNEGLSHEQLDQGILHIQEAINNLKNDLTAQWILSPHTDHQSEFPISGIIDGIIQDRIIDRTFIDENNVRWIIDYKTGEHEGADLDQFFQQEIDRYRLQLDTYSRLLQQNGEIRTIKKALYYPFHQKLVEIS